MIEEKDLLKLKTDLEVRQKELEEKIKKLSSPVDFGDDTEGSSADEESDETEEFGNNLAIAEVLKKELVDVKGALERIEKGEYSEHDKHGEHI
jgi:RNA polymerase-binding transcription factor DksA